MVEDERASIKNSGDVGGVTNHRDYGSNVNSALLGSPVSEATNDTLEGLHLNNGYQVVRFRDLSVSQRLPRSWFSYGLTKQYFLA